MRAAFSRFWKSIPAIWLYGFFLLLIFHLLAGWHMMDESLDVALHDTYYVVAHFHYLVGVAIAFMIFGFIYSFFGKIFRVKYNRRLAVLHFLLFFSGSFMVSIPQYFLGWQGMPKRYVDYPDTFAVWNKVSSLGAIIVVIGTAAFFLVVIEALVVKRPIGDRNAK